MQMQLQQLHMKTSASVPSLRQRQVFRKPHLSAFFLYPHDTAPHGLAPSLVAIPPTLRGETEHAHSAIPTLSSRRARPLGGDRVVYRAFIPYA
jgi:hypothetical protein